MKRKLGIAQRKGKLLHHIPYLNSKGVRTYFANIRQKKLKRYYIFNKSINAHIAKREKVEEYVLPESWQRKYDRVGLMKMYYTANKKYSRTPDPLCEFRVYVITNNSAKYTEKRFEGVIRKIEYSFKNVGKGVWHRNLRMETKGLEVEELGEDEAQDTMLKAGIKFETDVVMRLAIFYNRSGKVAGEYNERWMRKEFDWRPL